MIFPSFPKRSSSDDDALDQALNAWVSGNRHSDPSRSSGVESPRGAQIKAMHPANDALEFHRWADESHRTDPAATGPAADTWNRVLRSTAQTTHRGGDMSSVALNTEPQAAIVYDSRPYNRGQISRYLNVAASVIIVAAVALGGWFATMQLNQPGGSNGQFAFLGQMDESATCEAEPMTVDEVMEIVENPYSVFEIPYEIWVTGLGIETFDELFEPPSYMIDRDLLNQETAIPDESSFADASSRMNEFLGCTQAGSVAQIFRFMVPMEIQRIVLSNYPVFRDEAQVREGVEELLAYPAYQLVAQMNAAIQEPGLSFYVNPNREDAGGFSSQVAQKFGATQMILFGTTVVDADGEIVFQNNASGFANPVGSLKTTDRLRVLMVQPRFDEEWYVLAVIPE